MKKTKILILMIIACAASSSVNAAGCVANNIGAVICSRFPGGDAAVNSIGAVVCGKGECAVNSIGAVMCSRFPGGGAAVNSIGAVKCLEGCERGSKSMCVRGR